MNYQFTKNNLPFASLAFVVILLLQTLGGVGHSSIKNHPNLDITTVAEGFLESYYRTETGNNDVGFQLRVIPLDARVSLKHCDQQIEAFWPYKPSSQRRVTIGIRCTGEVRWKVYVQAEVKLIKSVAVLIAPVGAGDILSDNLISMQNTDTLTLRTSAIDDVTDLLGMKFVKNLRAGTVLSPKHLAIPISVKRGDIVNILSGSGPVSVTAQGFALADGHINELIKVRNSTSKQIVQAYVIKTGTVQIVQ